MCYTLCWHYMQYVDYVQNVQHVQYVQYVQYGKYIQYVEYVHHVRVYRLTYVPTKAHTNRVPGIWYLLPNIPNVPNEHRSNRHGFGHQPSLYLSLGRTPTIWGNGFASHIYVLLSKIDIQIQYQQTYTTFASMYTAYEKQWRPSFHNETDHACGKPVQP